jgi:hypothetical protein
MIRERWRDMPRRRDPLMVDVCPAPFMEADEPLRIAMVGPP